MDRMTSGGLVHCGSRLPQLGALSFFAHASTIDIAFLSCGDTLNPMLTFALQQRLSHRWGWGFHHRHDSECDCSLPHGGHELHVLLLHHVLWRAWGEFYSSFRFSVSTY